MKQLFTVQPFGRSTKTLRFNVLNWKNAPEVFIVPKENQNFATAEGKPRITGKEQFPIP